MTFLCFSSLIQSLPSELKSANIIKEIGPIIPLKMNLVIHHHNFPRFAYDVYIENRLSETVSSNTKQKEKWLRDVGCLKIIALSQ